MIRKTVTGDLDIEKLEKEVNASSVSVPYNGMRVDYGATDKVISFYFDGYMDDADETLDTGDQTKLDDVVTSHDGIIDVSDDYEIYDSVGEEDHKKDKKKAPKEMDYNILGLKKKRTFNKGELEKVEYYKDYDEATKVYSNLAVREDIVYTIDADENYSKRDKAITRKKKDGSDGETKNTKKYYSPDEAYISAHRRRSYLIDHVKVITVGLIMQTELVDAAGAKVLGFPFMDDYKVEMHDYVDGNRQPLIDVISADPETVHTWLGNDIGGGVTVKQYLVSELTY